MDINELKEEYKESQRILSRLDQVISNLKSKAKYAEKEVYQKFYYLIAEKSKLKRKHENKLKDIEKYKFQLLELEKKLDFQKSKIYELTKEREKLKAKKRGKTPKKIINKNMNNIDNIRESFGFFLKDNDQNIRNDNLNNAPVFQDENEFEKLKKLKKNLESVYHKLHEEIVAYYNDANNQKNYLTNYKYYINSIYRQINSFKQNLSISVNGGNKFNFGETKTISNQLTKEMEAILYIINKENNNLSTIKNKTLKKGENILRDIETNLSKINNNKNLNLKFLSKRMDIIEKQIESLKKINQMLQSSLSDIHQKNKIIENKIYSLNINFEKYIKVYQKGKKKIKDVIHDTIRKNGKNIFSSINKSLNNEIMDENDIKNYNIICDVIEEEEDDSYDEDIIRGITLIKVKDFGKQINLFKTTLLFKNQNEAKENKSKNPKILSKNWNEVCYIYDDYDIHDINYEIKAVGLQPYSYFDYYSKCFYIEGEIKIIDFEINGKRVNYYYDNYNLECDINLYNLQSAKIHLKYRERPKFDSFSKNEIDFYNFYRRKEYGLDESLKGQMGKYRIILKGSFEIVSFEDDFFIRNEKNQKEKEYIWGGKVPIDGKRTIVSLSKREAIFEINLNYQIKSKSGNIKDAILYIPIQYIGGNNDIINFDYSSPQTKKIYIDKKSWTYEIQYKNTGYQEGNFIVKGKIKNRCYGSWDVDLTDEMIKKNIPIKDQKEKYALEKIARSIIADYDKNNEKNILSFMDYAKIGKWVYKNIRYDLSYVGREMTAMDIYKQRVGVCSHMTKLANALLYSLGYDVIEVSGYACDSLEFEKDCYHAWSLVKIKGKWYPFDTTWGIFMGKLPVSHAFSSFFNEGFSWSSHDKIEFNYNISGKFIK